MSKDHYRTLGVARDADGRALKSAYRKLVMRHHPDRNPGDPEAEAKFKAVSEAYEILSDPKKRAAYDSFGSDAFSTGAGSSAGRSPEDIFGDVFGDVFSEFFGSGSRRRDAHSRGADLRRDVEITLEEAFTGTHLEIAFTGNTECADCSGSGAAPGTRPENCAGCEGSGRMRTQQGFFTMEHTCPRCQGRGTIVRAPCAKCRGGGRVSNKRQVRVEIPVGIDHGQRIRLDGQGEPGPQGGPPGDLYVFVSVAEHELFRRKGEQLNTHASIPMTTAALGGTITLPMIDGEAKNVQVPEGAQSGDRLTVNGGGMPSLHGARRRGNLSVDLTVETPRNLTAKQKELLGEFAEICSGESHPESESFLSRVKNFFDRDSASA